MNQRPSEISRLILKVLIVLPIVIALGISPATAESFRHVDPVVESPNDAEFEFRGTMGDRTAANVRNWLLVAPDSNPAMLQMFRDRDRTPKRDLVPWAGEFAGKYLISATQALKITRDPELKSYLEMFVADLIATQDADGYLGPFPKEIRMTGPGLWDLWGQYHVMLGLLYWHRLTGDTRAMEACRRCADYFCRYFLDGNRRVAQAGSEEMNESSIHIFTLLYEATGEPRYLQMASEIEKDWELPPSGDYVRQALAGKEFYQMPKPRWESLHSIQAIAELYFITGDEKYRTAFAKIWESIRDNDVHNTGGFSSGEQATGNPYDPRPIETCCTIAWMAITLDYLRMTGDSRAADELERSTWNAVLGAQNPTGRWWTYNTPMDGERKASAHEIVFQARAGSPELNCCAVNGPRGLGMLSEWAVMEGKDGIYVNYYGSSKFTIHSPSGKKVTIGEETEYPVGGKIVLKIKPEHRETFALCLRVPEWLVASEITVNGKSLGKAKSGAYFVLNRTWRRGDQIAINFAMPLRSVAGHREKEGKVSIHRGPLLLAHDPRFDNENLKPRILRTQDVRNSTPQILLSAIGTDRSKLTLCDFASAGWGGNPYLTWLPPIESDGNPRLILPRNPRHSNE